MNHLHTFDDTDKEALISQLRDLDFETGFTVITHAETYVGTLLSAEEKLVTLQKDQNDLINLDKYKIIFDLIALESTIRYCVPWAKFSPYIELCFDLHKILKEKIKHNMLTDEEKVKTLRIIQKVLKTENFKKEVTSKKNSVMKNKKSLLKYINNLFAQKSRLLVLRIDLGYSKARTLPEVKFLSKRVLLCPPRQLEPFGKTVREDKKSLLKILRKEYGKSFLGYIWKLEYGSSKGFHYHMIFFLDGSKYREDITITRSIGEIWKSEITKGRGNYWNLNADKARFEKNDRVATGMINSNDQKKRENLTLMAEYLIKPDYFVKRILPEKARTFGKGTAKKKIKAGRPRTNK